MSSLLNLSTVTTLMVAILIYAFYSAQWISGRLTFIGLTLVLISYLWLEIRKVKRLEPKAWLINPVVLASCLTFMLIYGFSNFIFFFPVDDLALLGLAPEVTPAMVKLLAIVIAAAFALWSGYWSSDAMRWCQRGNFYSFKSRFFPISQQYRSLTLPSLLLIATITRLLQVRLGVYGYNSTYERLLELGSITQYLAYGSAMGKLALVLVSLQFFAAKYHSRKVSLYFYLTISLEIFWGLLSGFKSGVVLPFVIVIMIKYLMQGVFSLRWLFYFLFGLVVAYAVIEPFRFAKNNDPSFDTTSIVSIASALSSREAVKAAEDSVPFVVAFLSRQNLTLIGSYGLDYLERFPNGRSGDPDILSEILLAPIYAWIPRILWDGKPLGDIGLWYTQAVLEKDHFSSTGMGMVTYLYMAGGLLLIFSAYFFTGFLLKLLCDFLSPKNFLPGAVVFVAGVLPIAINNDTFSGTLTSLFRELPLLIVLQFLIFKRGNRGSKLLPGNPVRSNQSL